MFPWNTRATWDVPWTLRGKRKTDKNPFLSLKHHTMLFFLLLPLKLFLLKVPHHFLGLLWTNAQNAAAWPLLAWQLAAVSFPAVLVCSHPASTFLCSLLCVCLSLCPFRHSHLVIMSFLCPLFSFTLLPKHRHPLFCPWISFPMCPPRCGTYFSLSRGFLCKAIKPCHCALCCIIHPNTQHWTLKSQEGFAFLKEKVI